MKRDKITRRKFVAGTTGAAVGAMIVPRHALGGPGYIAPSDKLNVAVVGCGGQGASDASELWRRRQHSRAGRRGFRLRGQGRGGAHQGPGR